jgi:hypothetical protein
MCIINDPADVSSTKILVAPNSENYSQITVYSNEVNTMSDNLMILPVPHPNTIKLINLENYNDIFKDLEKLFTIQDTYGTLGVTGRGIIKVHDVGSYLVSVANNYDELNMIDKIVFGTISPHIKKSIGKYIYWYYRTVWICLCVN